MRYACSLAMGRVRRRKGQLLSIDDIGAEPCRHEGFVCFDVHLEVAASDGGGKVNSVGQNSKIAGGWEELSRCIVDVRVDIASFVVAGIWLWGSVAQASRTNHLEVRCGRDLVARTIT